MWPLVLIWERQGCNFPLKKLSLVRLLLYCNSMESESHTMNADKRKPEIVGGDTEQGPEKSRWWFLLVVSTVGLALLSALATFVVLAGIIPIVVTREVVNSLFITNGVLIFILIFFVIGEGLRLLRARRSGQAAAGLHARIVGLFVLTAGFPAVLVAVMGWLTLERGIDLSFGRYVQELLTTSVEVARSFRELQCRALGREINLMGSDLSRIRPAFEQNRVFFHEFMRSRAAFLGFPISLLITDDGTVLEKIELQATEGFVMPTQDDMKAADDLEAWCLIPKDNNIFRAILKVPSFKDTYLVVARGVDQLALDFPRQAEAAADYYDALTKRKLEVQVAFASMYAVVSIILLLSAALFGLNFANRLVTPIRRLIDATDEVASGNYDVAVHVSQKEGDLGHLGETFNKMTSELRLQHHNLIIANKQIDERRRFTEAVLGGVPAGVIGVSPAGIITVVNPEAARLLESDQALLLGRGLSEIAPELQELYQEAMQSRSGDVQSEILWHRQKDERILSVRITSEDKAEGQSSVVTLDDISDLVAAQRSSAWADVARRIAHEIKNPLTPIQLSAERIRRKYGKVITADRDVFDQCTDTIIRQVDDIKRMVDEFSSFARMPKPLPESEDLLGTIRQVLFLMRIGNPDIVITENVPSTPVTALYDRRLVSQALTNIVKNATEAIAAYRTEGAEPGYKPLIEVNLQMDDMQITIDVIDNGKGFPKEARARLLEPYMTTRNGGTGLGLAIVGKILEEHGGGIALLDRADGERGACVRLWLPIPQPASAGESQQADNQSRGHA